MGIRIRGMGLSEGVGWRLRRERGGGRGLCGSILGKVGWIWRWVWFEVWWLVKQVLYRLLVL